MKQQDSACGIPHCMLIEGGHALSGDVTVAGSKIYSVPILALSLLSDGVVSLQNLPLVSDVEVWLDILGRLNALVERRADKIVIDPLRASLLDLSSDLIKQVHGTIYLLPVLLARFGSVALRPLFGGCQIGYRPVDHILRVMQAFGATIEITKSGEVRAHASHLRGCRISASESSGLDKYRSGITKTAILLGVAAEGETVIDGAYQRGSIRALASFVRALGGSIEGDGTPIIRLAGSRLNGGSFFIPGDYLEALTFACLAGMTKGRISVHGFYANDCQPELGFLTNIGIKVQRGTTEIAVACDLPLSARSFSTDHIDTDIQPLFSVLLSQCAGVGIVEEKVWENRFGFAREMLKLGASVEFPTPTTIVVRGPSQLRGGLKLQARDLRGAAALIAVGAAAEGQTQVSGLEHLARGYSDFFPKLRQLGLVFSIENELARLP